MSNVARPNFAQSPLLVGGAPIYVTGEDALLMRIFNAAAGVRVRLAGRFLPIACDDDDHPLPTPFENEITTATDRSVSSLVHGLGEGWLLEASIIPIAGAPLIGQCFAQLALQRGLASSARVSSRLVSGYVTAQQAIAWPGSPIVNSLEGAGALRSITGATPAAGAEISETVPTGARWELLTLRAILVSAVAVANRDASLTLDDGTNEYWRVEDNNHTTASTTVMYNYAQGFAGYPAGSNNRRHFPLPIGNRLGAGHRIRTATLNLQAADQWSAPQYLVREWQEGA